MGYSKGWKQAQNCFGVYSYRLITFVLQAWFKSTSFILFRPGGLLEKLCLIPAQPNCGWVLA